MSSEQRSLLFLSCDIVGSTRFKQQANTLWQRTFLSFYREFPQKLGDLTRSQQYTPGFELWKPIGDELIFTSEVRCEKDVYDAVRIWLGAMSMYEDDVLQEVSLSTKGGAFIATFPGPDSESTIPRNPETEVSDKGVVELNDEALAGRSADYLYDYFGPSIDTGFRVVSACSHRHFTMSIEVAWAASKYVTDVTAAAGVRPSEVHLDDMRLLDTREFKGVWDGRPYPLFALDRHHEDFVNVALAKLENNDVDPSDVVNLCRECSATASWPSAIYLPDSEHGEFTIEPQDSLAALRSNSMDGAETVPEDSEGRPLRDDAPLG